MASSVSMDELTKFGIVPDDEGPHACDPGVEWWNESWFWDWFDASGKIAGHCRIGTHPNQKRAWVWFYLYRAGEWIVVEEPRLPLADLALPELAYDRWGLRFGYDVIDPLRRGRFRFDGFGRAVSGPRTGMIVPVGADLEIVALGAPHSQKRGSVAGHSSERYPNDRFEQPITAQGVLRIEAESIPFDGRGERDHSWGPRHWNLEWIFLVLSGEDLRLQCSEARVPNAGTFHGGYLHRDTSISITDVDFDLVFDDANLAKPVSGRFALRAEDGSRVAAAIEVLASAEIDLTHTFVPPRRSVYRRVLLRAHRQSGSPLLGWMEFNYFPAKE